MRFSLPVPRMVAEANERVRFTRDGLSAPVNLVVEILIFTLVFLVVGIVFEGVLLVLGMLPLLLTNESFLDAMGTTAAQGKVLVDAATTAKIADQLALGPGLAILGLFATAGGIIGVSLYCRAIEGRKLATMGLRRGRILREYFAGIVIGFVLFGAAVLICLATGTMNYAGLALGSAGVLVVFFLGFMVQGMSEELICRGYFLVSLARKQSLAVAVVVSSCAFGGLHLANANVSIIAILNIILFGCFMGVYLLKRGNIWGAAAIHTAWNFAQGNVFGVPVSGMNTMPSVFAFNATEGGALINGGAFGIEGGLAATFVLTVALVVALLLKSADPAPRILADPNGNLQVAIIPGKYPPPSQPPVPPEASPLPAPNPRERVEP